MKLQPPLLRLSAIIFQHFIRFSLDQVDDESARDLSVCDGKAPTILLSSLDVTRRLATWRMGAWGAGTLTKAAKECHAARRLCRESLFRSKY